jgi:hypothetical protein
MGGCASCGGLGDSDAYEVTVPTVPAGVPGHRYVQQPLPSQARVQAKLRRGITPGRFGGTHGVFSQGTPWALPPYVSAEPSPLDGFGASLPGLPLPRPRPVLPGHVPTTRPPRRLVSGGRGYYNVAGYGGFGGEINIGGTMVSCDTSIFIDVVITKIEQALKQIVVVPETGVDVLGVKVGTSALTAYDTVQNLGALTALRNQLRAIGNAAVDQMVTKAQDGEAAFKLFFRTAVAPAVSRAFDYNGVPLLGTADPGAITDHLAGIFFGVAVQVLNSCRPDRPTAVPAPDDYDYAPVVRYTPSAIDAYQKALIQQSALSQRAAIDPRVAAGQIQLYKPQAATQQTPTPTPGGGGVTPTTTKLPIVPLAIGAAAIALLALRR